VIGPAAASGSGRTQVLRALVAVLAPIAASLSFGDALSTIALVDNPRAALSVLQSNGYALAARANNAIIVTSGTPDPIAAERYARAALANDPVNPGALRALGIAYEMRGNLTKSRPFFRLAQRTTRRDIATNIWHINDASQSGDLKTTLYQYDVAIRTTKEAHALLFATLTTALEDAEIRQAFVPYFHNPPPWLPVFLDFAIDQSKSPAVLADLAERAGGFPKSAEYRSREGFLLDRLAVLHEFSAARALYRLLPDANTRSLTTIDLTPVNLSKDRAPINWKFFADSEKGAAIEDAVNPAGASRLSLFAQPNVSGIVAQKILYLPVGKFRIRAILHFVDEAIGGAVSLTLNCETKSGQTVITTHTASSSAAGPARVDFSADVPSSCPVQSMTITTRGGTTVTMDAAISGLKLEPAPQ
jgi:hypothetical protein